MSQKSTKKIVVPEAKAAMEQFKMQAAQEVGVNLEKGYNGNLTSREAGSVGGQMVKKMNTVRTVNTYKTAKFIRTDRTSIGHAIEVRYTISVVI
jgi:small acid-soluble spore protein D (minor alpha/beta-type SASP)